MNWYKPALPNGLIQSIWLIVMLKIIYKMAYAITKIRIQIVINLIETFFSIYYRLKFFGNLLLLDQIDRTSIANCDSESPKNLSLCDLCVSDGSYS